MTTQLVPWPGGADNGGEWLVDSADPSLAWDRMAIAGVEVPGLASVDGDGLKNEIDKKKPQGASGATTTFKGRDVAGVTITLRIFTAADWDKYQQAVHPMLVQKVGQKYAPVSVDHPAIALFGITALAIESMSLPKFEHGVLTLTVKASQWSPAKATGAQTPNKAKKSWLPPVVTDKRSPSYDAAYHADHPNDAGPPPPPAPSYTSTGP